MLKSHKNDQTKNKDENDIFQNIRLSISAPKISSSWVCFWLSLASQGLENIIWSKQGLENWNYVFFSDFPIPVLLHKSKTGNGKLEWKTGLENWIRKLEWKTGLENWNSVSLVTFQSLFCFIRGFQGCQYKKSTTFWKKYYLLPKCSTIFSVSSLSK